MNIRFPGVAGPSRDPKGRAEAITTPSHVAQTQAPKLRVNVGCGVTPVSGWVDFDNSPTILIARLPFGPTLLGRSRAEFVSRIRSGEVSRAEATRLPLREDTADAVYSCHMLEHLERAKARQFLAEARRVLRPGGVLRIAVPDLRAQAERYVSDGDADAFVAGTYLAASDASN